MRKADALIEAKRRWRRILVLGACALVFYLLHFAWFAAFGPPEWFQGVEQRAPEMTSVRLGSAFDDYLDEFSRPRQASLGQPDFPPHAGAVGRIVRVDRMADPGPAVLQTRDEGRDFLYYWSSDRGSWWELTVPTSGRAGEAVLAERGGDDAILLAHRRSWWPFVSNYGRFWTALLRPELRPQVGLYLIDPDSRSSRYLFSGRRPMPSPDRGRVAFLRSERHGFHSVHIWSAAADEIVTVASLWEADPGSGVSFHYTWSRDSAVLYVRGSCLGFESARPATAPIEVGLLYDVAGDRLVEIK